jgi:hypothetical protein
LIHIATINKDFYVALAYEKFEVKQLELFWENFDCVAILTQAPTSEIFEHWYTSKTWTSENLALMVENATYYISDAWDFDGYVYWEF